MRVTLLFLALLMAPALSAQQTSTPPPAHQHGGASEGRDEKMMGMMARMDTLDARLDSLRVAMHRASCNRKLEAIERLLDALVAQHLDMHREMGEKMRDSERMGRMMHGHDESAPDSATAGHEHNH